MKTHRALFAATTLLCGAVQATELVYTPVNPSFGGNPLNGPVLLNSANAQNTFKDPAQEDLLESLRKSSQQSFNDRLQSLVLSSVANALTKELVDSSGNLTPGTIETDTFKISVTEASGVFTITTVDKTTGQTSSFVVGTGP